MAKKELAVADQRFPVLAESSAREVLAANIGGEGGSVFDLEQVKIPPAGGDTWMLPTLEGVEAKKEFSGIIVWHGDIRTYWSEPMGDDGSGGEPDCSSLDAVTGKGNPGGQCAKCPFAQWESAAKGKGQACTLKKRLLIVREGSMLPTLFDLPPSSLSSYKKYMFRISNARKMFFGVVTKFGLSIKSSPTTHSVADLDVDKILSDEETSAMQGYAAELIKSFRLEGGNAQSGGGV